MTDHEVAVGPQFVAAAVRLVVLDTDAWSTLFLVPPKKLSPERAEHRRELADAITGMSVAIAVQTRAEMLTLPAMRDMGEKRAKALRDQLDSTTTIPVNDDVVEAWIRLTAECKKVGHPLAEKPHAMDRWIAATAVSLDVPLLAVDKGYLGAPLVSLLEYGAVGSESTATAPQV